MASHLAITTKVSTRRIARITKRANNHLLLQAFFGLLADTTWWSLADTWKVYAISSPPIQYPKINADAILPQLTNKSHVVDAYAASDGGLLSCMSPGSLTILPYKLTSLTQTKPNDEWQRRKSSHNLLRFFVIHPLENSPNLEWNERKNWTNMQTEDLKLKKMKRWQSWQGSGKNLQHVSDVERDTRRATSISQFASVTMP